jgi:hypothetical protein
VQIIRIIGGASGKTQKLNVEEQDLDQNLLKWLRLQGITIASSCDGEGVCKKCSIQNDWLTCKLTLRDLFKYQPDGKVFVPYL